MKVVAIVPAAGSGKRLKKNIEKPFIKLRSKPLLFYTLKVLNDSPVINRIILVVKEGLIKKGQALVKRYNFKKVKSIVKGGPTRGDSVLKGLNLVDKDIGYVLIHDGARPLLEGGLIKRSVKAAERFGASCVCVPAKPTVKLSNGGYISKTLNRNLLWETQTPQVFKKEVIFKAYRNKGRIKSATDDASLVEKLGYKVRIVRGSYRNIKITTEEDLLLAKALLK